VSVRWQEPVDRLPAPFCFPSIRMKVSKNHRPQGTWGRSAGGASEEGGTQWRECCTRKAEHRFRHVGHQRGRRPSRKMSSYGVGQGILDTCGASEDSPEGKAVMEGIRAFWERHLDGMDPQPGRGGSAARSTTGALEGNTSAATNGVEAVVVPFWEAILDPRRRQAGTGRSTPPSSFQIMGGPSGFPKTTRSTPFGALDGRTTTAKITNRRVG